MDKTGLNCLEERIGYVFQDRSLLLQAVTHSSYSNEKQGRIPHYERLEFLGDAVLEMVTSVHLFRTYPEKKEGEMTKMRAALVCEQSLSSCASRLELSGHLLLSYGEDRTGGRRNDSILADAVESLIGAIFLDGGVEKAEDFIHRFVLDDIENKVLFFDAKSVLQELVQGKSLPPVRYHLIEESGPEHKKTFTSEVVIGDRVCGRGQGKNKKASEQGAAYQAILRLKADGQEEKKE